MMTRMHAALSFALLAPLSVLKNAVKKLAARIVGISNKRATRTYHQWIPSLRSIAKISTRDERIKNKVKIPIDTIPHLIGKHPKHERLTVSGLEQWQMQQQHISPSATTLWSGSALVSSRRASPSSYFWSAAGAATGSSAAASPAALASLFSASSPIVFYSKKSQILL